MSFQAQAATPGRILSVQGLRTGFGANTVLHGVDFEVAEGEIVAILGLNGAGKSVTMKTVAGVVDAWAGSIHYRGRSIKAMSVEERVGLGIAHVTQGRQVFPDLSVEENLRLGAYLLRKRDRARYPVMLEKMFTRFPRLGERREQQAGTLSGGEQAMLALARALIAEPSLMLVDEPTAGLAPVVVEQLLDSLKEVNGEGIAILLVEQHVPFALRLADRVLIMQRGTIVYESAVTSLDQDTMVQALGIGRLLTAPAKPARKRRAAPAKKTGAKKRAPAAKRTVAKKTAQAGKKTGTRKKAAS